MSKLLNVLGLMKKSEHEGAMNVYRSDWQDLCGRAIQDRDSAEAKFKLAATDLAAQAEEIKALHSQNALLRWDNDHLRPDAQAMRRKRQMDRDRKAGKAVKS